MAHSLGSPNPFNFPFSSKSKSPSSLSFGYCIAFSSVLTHRAVVAKALDLKEKRVANCGGAASPLPKLPIPFSSISGAPQWLKRILRTLILFFLPSYKTAICFEEQVEKAAGTILNTVETAAKAADNIAHEIEENLPPNSPLKKLAFAAGKISEEVVKDAEIAETLDKKIDDMVEEVDSSVDSIIEELKGIPAVKKSSSNLKATR